MSLTKNCPDRKTQNTREAKKQSQELAKEKGYEIEEKYLSRRVLKIKNRASELPTFEIKFKTKHLTCDAAWKDGVNRLAKLAAQRLQEKQNLKIVVGWVRNRAQNELITSSK